MTETSRSPSILTWINSPMLRRVELWLWKHPKIAWFIFGLILAFIFLPQAGGALWYSFSNEPPIPAILKKMISVSQMFHFSASWITVPLGIAMFIALLLMLRMGKRVSKSEVSNGGLQLKATGTVSEPCPDQWLHELAKEQAKAIAGYVQLEKPFTYDHRLTDAIPSIGFKFPVRNYSVFEIAIDESIKGEIYYDGVRLAEPMIVRYADSGIGFRQLGGISIEQRLTPTEASHIAKMQGTFHFSALEIMIKGGTGFPQVLPQRLRITEYEHSLYMQSEVPAGSLLIKTARYGARDRWADVTAVVQALVSSERLKIDKRYNDIFRDDPYPGQYKMLTIEYLHNGLPFSISVPEDTRFELPVAYTI